MRPGVLPETSLTHTYRESKKVAFNKLLEIHFSWRLAFMPVVCTHLTHLIIFLCFLVSCSSNNPAHKRQKSHPSPHLRQTLNPKKQPPHLRHSQDPTQRMSGPNSKVLNRKPQPPPPRQPDQITPNHKVHQPHPHTLIYHIAPTQPPTHLVLLLRLLFSPLTHDTATSTTTPIPTKRTGPVMQRERALAGWRGSAG